MSEYGLSGVGGVNRALYFSLSGFMRNGLEKNESKDALNPFHSYTVSADDYGEDVTNRFVRRWNEMCGKWKVDRGISFHAT